MQAKIMALHTVRSSWTLFSLLSVFFDLGVAYFLLCISTAVYFCVRFASVFGLCLPCPCCCLLGHRNGSDSCFFKLIVEILLRGVDSVHRSVRSRVGLSSTGFEDHGGNLGVDLVVNRKAEEGCHGLDTEGCCSSLSVVAWNSGDREGGVEVKEKGYGNQKPKSGVRRRRRGRLKCAKFISFTSSNSLKPAVSGVSSCSYDHNSRVRSEIGESVDAGSGIQGGFPYDGKVTNANMVDERIWNSIELSGSFSGSNSMYMDSSSVENSDTNEKLHFDRNEADRIRSLELALEREKAACAALYVELEKERAAAATAADEAIAMILRLQKEKAALEMEVRQDQRMTEEQLAYDEGEMNLLKEILIRKERENYFLETEVKTYKQMLPSLDVYTANQLQDIRDKRVARSSSFHPDVGSGLPIAASVAEEGDMAYPNKSTDPSTSLAMISIPDVASESHQSVVLQCQGMMLDQPCISSKDSRNLHDSVPDKLPVHDVYVVDDNTEPKNLKNKEQNTSAIVGSFAQIVDSDILPDSPEILSSDITVDFTRRGKEEIEQNRHMSKLDNNSGRIGPTASGSNSLFDVNSAKLKLDMEMEWLREMLRIVQKGKEQLKSSGDSKRKWKTQLKLPDNWSQEFPEMQQLHEPLRHASLPTVSSKVNTGNRPYQSMTWRSYESD